MHLSALDLNLLVALDALLEARNVTRAAQKLGLSQSALSHALARLRTALGDPLLVRGAGGLVPTARAEAMREPLREALETLTRTLAAPRPFDPATARRTFRVTTTDYAQFVLLPGLLERLAAEAPGVDLWVVTPPEGGIDQALASGELDLVVTPPRRTARTAGLQIRHLFEERFVCVVREGHPGVGEALTLETFAALPHAFVAPGGRHGGVVDDALAAHGLERRVALAVPHFLVVPWAVAASDLVVTLASRLAVAFAALTPLRVLEPPVTLPGFSMAMTWHERQHHDPGHAWLRGLLAGVAGALPGSGVTPRGPASR